jgi:hypothetical protein
MIRTTVAVAFAVLLLPVMEAGAQSGPHGGTQFTSQVTGGGRPRQVLSTVPFVFMVGIYTAEYEVRVEDNVTIGAGATYTDLVRVDPGDKPYMNGDAFIRYYPNGTAFNGFSLSGKAGYMRTPGDGSFVGLGTQANYSVMVRTNFYLGAGLGVKLLLPLADRFFLKGVPTARLNVGIGF